MRSYNLPFKYPFKISTTLLFIILLFSIQNIFAQSGWQSTFDNNVFIINKIIKRDSLNYIAFSNSSKNYLKSTNGGDSWLSLPELALDSAFILKDGIFINSNTGWIIGYNYNPSRGIVYKTVNGGINWIYQYIGISSYSFDNISFVDEYTGWICSSGNPSLIKTTNGGLSWFGILSTNNYLTKVKFLNPNLGWLIFNNGLLSKTTNGGQTWKIDSTLYNYTLKLWDVCPISENECWILARAGNFATRYFKTTNGGLNWNQIYTSPNLLTELKFFDSNIGLSFGQSKVILKTTNSGISWDSIGVNSTYPVNSVLIIDQNKVLAAGGLEDSYPTNTYVNILKSSNCGLSWSQNYFNRNYNFVGINFKDAQTGIAIEQKGLIFKTTNAGNNWTKIYENLDYAMANIKLLNDTNLLIFRSSGNILRTTDYGLNWTEIFTSGNASGEYVDFLDNFTGYMMSYSFLHNTSNGGMNWNIKSVPQLTGLSGFKFINLNTGWMFSAFAQIIGGHGTYYSNTILKTTNAGSNWTTSYYSNSSLQYTRFKFFDENSGWTWVGSNIYKSSDGGSNWLLYSQYPNFTFHWLYMINDNTGWMSGTNGSHSSICKTTNGGLNWFLQFNEGNGYINSVFIKDENNVWACGYNGIYKTTNGGGIISSVMNISNIIPTKFSLSQNYPNPFNPTTKINFDLKNSAFAKLRVYDITGREVKTLVNEKLSAGSYSYDFNASELPSGVYFYQLQAEGFIETKKMILLK